MSLSRFYKKNEGFQARAILDNISSAGDGPVWGSIVKEVPVEETTDPSESLSPQQNDSPEVEDQISTETNATSDPTTQQQKNPPQPTSPPSSPPAQPMVDVEAIRNKAYLEGITEGRKQAEEDFENSSQTLINVCQELNNLRETILRNSTEEMKELVLGIAEKIIRHSVTNQHDTIVETIKDAIQLAVQSDAFQIRLNPDDLKAVEARKKEIIESINSLDNIVLKSDSMVDLGGCLLESSCCTVDASLASQLKVIKNAIMADENLINNKGQES